MASSSKKPSEEALLDWYADLQPLTVDIVGDFAGRELFLIHGEALMRHCLIEARVDFDSRCFHFARVAEIVSDRSL
jgi:ATP-dependent RNA helicase DDX60